MTCARSTRLFIMFLAAWCCVGIPIAAGGDLVSSTWICASDDWTETSCWDTLDGDDLYPDNVGGGIYSVTLPAGSYTVTVDPALDDDITIDELNIPESGPVLEVAAGKSFNVLQAFTAHADVTSFGTLSADAFAVIDIDESDLDALGGGTISLPVTSYFGSAGCASESINANGTGSAVILSELTSVDALTCGTLTFLASAGGFIDLSGLTSSVDSVNYTAEGVGSVVLLDQMSALFDGNVTVLDGGTILAAPFTSLDGVTVIVGDSTSNLDLSQVISIDEANVTAQTGASIAFPLVTSYTGTSGCGSETLTASGSGSVLDLTTLTSLDAMTCGSVTILATSGGFVDLSNLPASQNNVIYKADGAGSELRIDLLDTVLDGSVIVLSGGTIVAAPLTVLEGIGITVGDPSSSLDLTQVTSIDASNVTVQDDATVSFPLVTSYTGTSDCFSQSLVATGAGSVLDLSTFTTVDGETCGNSEFGAFSGGLVDLSNLTASENNVTYEADGAGSELRIDQISTLTDGAVAVFNGGTIVAGPFTVLDGVVLTVDDPSSTLDLSQVTSMEISFITVQDGGTVSLPLLTSYNGSSDCGSETIKATGAGSSLSMAGLTDLNGESCGNLNVQALLGAAVGLPLLSTVDGNVQFTVTGADAVLVLGSPHLDAGSLEVDEGTVVVVDSLSFETTDSNDYQWTNGATLRMLGGTGLGDCARLEIAGADLGDDEAGFVDNFQLEHLKIGPGAAITLTDSFSNGNTGGPGGCNEALYVDTLEFEDGDGHLATAGLNIYYNTLIGSESQILTVVCNAPCEGDANNDGVVDPLDSGFVLARFGCLLDGCDLGCEAADQNGDGTVDPLDSGFVLARFGPCP